MGKKGSSQSIEEIAESSLDEDKLKAFFDFYDFINSNKLGKAKSGDRWAVKYKNKRICSFYFCENSWKIVYFNLHQRDKWFEKFEKYLTVQLKDFILNNIYTTNTTRRCCINGGCNSAENRINLGKLFNIRVCACGPIELINPEGKTLEYAKELVMLGKNVIAEMTVGSIK